MLTSPQIARRHDRIRRLLAVDRAPDKSVRQYDVDGRLHVAVANISKANVCGYKGTEVPEYQALGLDPNAIYQMLRDPDELRKAAPTFNGLPILSQHVPVSATAHRPDLVIGSSGTNAEFVAPYLQNSLTIWSAKWIEAIESGEQRELSCGYHYRCIMQPGVFQGVRFDGRMVDLVGNHIATVPEGRAGDDVVIGDRALRRRR
jgi:hypothetical protein